MIGGDSSQTRLVGARVPTQDADAFEQLAASEDRTTSAELRRLIRRRLAEAGIVPTPARPRGRP